MKPVETFTITKQNAAAWRIGEEWAGEYEINMLTAREYLVIPEDYVQELRRNPNWNNVIPESEIRLRIVCKAVRHDKQAINVNIDMPSKIFEILSSKVLPLNTLSLAEVSTFLPTSSMKPPTVQA